jgi:hypothetical protein
LETKHSYEIRYWWATRLCFFGTEHAKGRRGRLKRVLHFGQYVGENSKYVSEYPENVVVKELPRFNAVKVGLPMLERRLCFESFSFTFRSRRILL